MLDKVLDKIAGAYVKADNAILRGAEKAVQAYNWTTGGTKADLSNNALSVSAITGISGLTFLSLPIGAVLSLPALISIHSLQNKNIKMEEREYNALESGALDPKVESFKDGCKYFGQFNLAMVPLNAVCSAGLSYQNDTQSALGALLITAHAASFSASQYFMRVPYIPPRKNCISRGLEKLTESMEKRKLAPALAGN